MTEGDWRAVTELYADDATIEDPVGSELCRGREAIEALYARACERVVTFEVTGPICVADGQVAFPLLVKLRRRSGDVSVLDVVDVMTFNPDGRIATMRAFWQPEDIRVESGGA